MTQLICGDNRKVVSTWKPNYVDAIVTDPPYGLEFMGKDWDKGLPGIRFWREFLRITKPGGFLLCFGGTRTYHRLACAIEDAGWQIRDCMMWLYGSGFPKSHDISKAIDKAAGAKRTVLKERYKGLHSGGSSYQYSQMKNETGNCPITAPATSLAQLWNGYGTALKPAWEPIIVAMKPKEGSFADNAEKYGVAGLNIDGGRIGTELIQGGRAGRKGPSSFNVSIGEKQNPHQGRWPANLILDEEAGKMLDEQSGVTKSTGGKTKSKLGGDRVYGKYAGDKLGQNAGGLGDSGGASRFFYCAKTSRKERNMGLEDQSGKKVNDGRQTPIDNPYQRGETIRKNTHPTVKPLALMKYLCTLLKMPSAEQIILDPFMGSGTTGMACASLGIGFIGIEKEREYCEISAKRISAISGQTLLVMEPAQETKSPPQDNKAQEIRQRAINAACAELRRRNQKCKHSVKKS